MIIIEPYSFCDGHFKKYLRYIGAIPKVHSIYTADEDFFLNRQTRVSPLFSKNNNENFIIFSLSRICNFFLSLCSLPVKKRGEVIHFLEYEPLSLLFFHFIFRKNKSCAIFTIHAIATRTHSSRMFHAALKAQRFLFFISLKFLERRRSIFVVHTESHREQLMRLITGPILINTYPCPSPLIETPKKITSLSKCKALIFGQIRKDKEVAKFLNWDLDFLLIKIRGKIYDDDVKRSAIVKKIDILDKFLSEADIQNEFLWTHFCLLPYGKGYTGGAGPLKDSMAHGTPVLCSDIPVFSDFLKYHPVGILFSTEDDLRKKIKLLKPEEYYSMSKKCLAYSKRNSWVQFAKRYEQIYHVAHQTTGLVW